MVELLVKNLELSVKEAIQRNAQHNGRSMEQEARLILWQAAEAEQLQNEGVGLGSQMAALFAGSGPCPVSHSSDNHHRPDQPLCAMRANELA